MRLAFTWQQVYAHYLGYLIGMWLLGHRHSEVLVPGDVWGFPAQMSFVCMVPSLIHALSEDKSAFTFPTEQAGLIVREFKSPMVLR